MKMKQVAKDRAKRIAWELEQELRAACDHKITSTSTRCYTGGAENQAAAGGVTYVETCDDCGAERQTHSNGCHSETTTWYHPDRSDVGQV